MITAESNIIARLSVYQKERFPFLLNGIAALAFTFSAISYSRISRGESGFVDWPTYFIGCFVSFGLFFMVRIFDEFKDKDIDAEFRPYLPVPRGIISLKELGTIAFLITGIQLVLILLFQSEMILLYLLAFFYLILMRYEFFIPKFLKTNRVIYSASHMMIIPLLDVYSSGLDWNLSSSKPHFGLTFFLLVTFFNGFIVEFGRKMNAPENEEEGVETYTGMWGIKKAGSIWILTLTVTFALALAATYFAQHELNSYIILIALFILGLIPAIIFIIKPTQKLAKLIAGISALWTLGMYLALGGIPMLLELF